MAKIMSKMPLYLQIMPLFDIISHPINKKIDPDNALH